jgi:hypothetical protein
MVKSAITTKYSVCRDAAAGELKSAYQARAPPSPDHNRETAAPRRNSRKPRRPTPSCPTGTSARATTGSATRDSPARAPASARASILPSSASSRVSSKTYSDSPASDRGARRGPPGATWSTAWKSLSATPRSGVEAPSSSRASGRAGLLHSGAEPGRPRTCPAWRPRASASRRVPHRYAPVRQVRRGREDPGQPCRQCGEKEGAAAAASSASGFRPVWGRAQRDWPEKGTPEPAALTGDLYVVLTVAEDESSTGGTISFSAWTSVPDARPGRSRGAHARRGGRIPSSGTKAGSEIRLRGRGSDVSAAGPRRLRRPHQRDRPEARSERRRTSFAGTQTRWRACGQALSTRREIFS